MRAFIERLKSAWRLVWPTVTVTICIFHRETNGDFHIVSLVLKEKGRTETLGPRDFPFDLIEHLHRQREFSERTFGPGVRTAGVLDHIRKELTEIEGKPNDLFEWVDVVLLALDGAWRAGFSPEEIAAAIAEKQSRNESRNWPDWRTAEPGKAIEHVRGEVA